ncbi:MAG: hypothetical protein J0M35_12405 [Candidatus Obscuribacter phosphatis]|uniref:Tetratricopeptide repeat protein n=1 Tax=Candidatus Obscuribacter phosphatis TaxID=1906157 RepID=A0A8J7TMU5_9BACT|nr:hypothetical protein [Candidatus Obscuribacter phosphatis]
MSEASTDISSEKKGVKKWILAVFALALLCGTVYIVFTPRQTPLDKAVALIRSSRSASAVPLLEELQKQNPSDPAVYPWLAQGYLATDRVAEGRTALDTAFRFGVKSDSHESMAAVVESFSLYYQNRGHYEEAERLCRAAAPHVESDKLAKILADLYFRWAENLMQAGNLEQAVEKLTALKNYAGYLDDPQKGQVPHKLARCYREMAARAETVDKDVDHAVLLYEKSLAACDEPSTRIALAAIYAQKNNKKKAVENYEAVAAVDANNLEVRHRLVELFLDLDDIEKAQVALSELVDKERSFENYELLAGLNLKLNNYAGAVRALEEACSLKPTAALLRQLIATLNKWSARLQQESKTQEALSVKGHAERVTEKLEALLKEERKNEPRPEAAKSVWNPGSPPVSIISSRNWLVRGSLTPEGEIKIKNISGAAVQDLTLTAVFWDNTKRQNKGSVVLPVASPTSNAFAPGAEKTLYFSCPNIVAEDHHLAVMILWKGKFLKEFPVVKQR